MAWSSRGGRLVSVARAMMNHQTAAHVEQSISEYYVIDDDARKKQFLVTSDVLRHISASKI